MDIGWNCHISLNDDRIFPANKFSVDDTREDGSKSDRNDKSFCSKKKNTANASLPNLYRNTPSTLKLNLVNLKPKTKKFEFNAMSSEDDDVLFFEKRVNEKKIVDDDVSSSQQTNRSALSDVEIIENAVGPL